MDQSQLKWIADFIWNIADDRLRDVYVRGKYRDVILPFTVLRRLDAVLESRKDAVLERKKFLDQHGIHDQEGALRMAAGQAFYNTSEFTLAKLKSSASGQRLRDNFIAYLDGFSPNVQEILTKFKFRDQIQTMVEADILGYLIADFLNPDVNLFRTRFEAAMKQYGKKPGAADKKALYKAVSWRDETAPPVISKRGKLKAGEFFEPGYDGAYLEESGKDRFLVEFEPDSDLRDTEQVPLKEPGGIEAFFEREVLPHAPDAWIAMDATKIGYEISFARYFYKPAPLRTLDQIRADILALEQQTEGLLHKIIGATT